ncbi:protein-tyrosine phosphatase-like protein [Paraphysoderma sedebokerense]|nr:protein-tyrosine phosphatase-like protein [Paraphysoderma sedebokerense]
MGRIAFYPTPFSAFIDDEPVCPFSGDNPGWVSNENRVKLLALAKSDDPPVHTRVYNYFHKRHRLYLARKMLQEFNNVITSLPGYNNPAATSFTLSRIFDLPHDGGSLYLSGAGGAKDLVSLKNVGITAILNVAHDDTNTGEDYYTSSNAAEKVGYAIQYKGVSCTDSPAFNIRDRFEECFEFLDRELKQIKDPAQSKKGRKSKKSRFGLTKTKETENDRESGSKTVTTGTTVTQNSVGASLSSNTIPRTSTPNTTTVLQQTRTGYSAQLTSISDTESPGRTSSSPQLPLPNTTTPIQPTQQMSSSPSQHPFSASRPQPPKILIHCSMGISRSATVLIAYLCKTYKLSLKDAVKIARTNRNLVCPNMGFRIQLIEFCIENKLKLW